MVLYNSNVCRLCGEESANGNLLYSCEENRRKNLCELINTYLPIKVADDGQLPRTICPGCTIQLEATVEFLTLIINGQKVIRELHLRQKEYKKTVFNPSMEQEIITDKIIYEVNTSDGVYKVEHPISLRAAGLEKPKRKRCRRKKPLTGKWKRKTLTMFSEAVQKTDRPRTETPVIQDDSQPQTTKSDSLSETVQIENVILPNTITTSLPDLNPQPIDIEHAVNGSEFLKAGPAVEITSSLSVDSDVKIVDPTTDANTTEKFDDVEHIETTPCGKPRLKCDHCGKTFSSKRIISSHIKASHQGERPHVCGECGLWFAYPRSLALHAVWHRRRAYNSKGFACDLCGKVLNHPSSLVHHIEVEHGGQRYVCNKCGKSFKRKMWLQRHQLKHTQDMPYNCQLCSASFSMKANLVTHSRIHPGVKKFSCEICKHKFKHKTNFTKHMRLHTDQKRYSCNVCGKSFSHKGSLSRHNIIHPGEKPFQCSLCPRKFETCRQHRLHVRRHISDKPYTCASCGKRFMSCRSWTAHVWCEAGCAPRREPARLEPEGSLAPRWPVLQPLRKYSAERPFRCAHCPRAFTECSNLNKHMKQAHKQNSLLATANELPAHSPIPLKVEEPDSPLIQLEEQTLSIQETSPVKSLQEAPKDEVEEREVIYMKYDVDDAKSPASHILDPKQAATLEDSKVLTTCELYSGPSLLVPQPENEQLELEHEQLKLEQEQLVQEELEQLPEELVLKGHDQNMPVTDEQGNPLHFTMQDGTRLAITSVDGKSLQVTHDGQTIPVDVNWGF